MDALTQHIKVNFWCLQTDLVKWDSQTPVKVVNMAQGKLERGLQGVKLHITAKQ